MSAKYLEQELRSEFGKIPPSFLPLGNRRLFQKQVALAPEGEDIFISLPESYRVVKKDLEWLKNNNVNIIRIPDGIELGASLVTALELSGSSLEEPLHVLYGDTLFLELPEGDNLVSVSCAEDCYNWAIVTDSDAHWIQEFDSYEHTKEIVNGYFKFSSPKVLVESIIRSNWDFILGVNIYRNKIGIISVYSGNWLDFGHVNTYYRSKGNYTTQRAFNDIKINKNWIEKSSSSHHKISAESNWFASLPYSLRGYIPQYLGSRHDGSQISYRLEYIHNISLNEMYVFSELPTTTWSLVLSSCISFLKSCLLEPCPLDVNFNSFDALFVEKTKSRLSEYCHEKNIDIKDKWIFNDNRSVSLEEVFNLSLDKLPDEMNTWPISVLHGDFCFSNILYDFRSNRIKTIDPRGISPSGELTIYGDIRYDIAKLAHSIIGMYDWIIAGYFELSVEHRNIYFYINESKRCYDIQCQFISIIRKDFSISYSELLAMQIQLFLSMLPLHGDDLDRQNALFANALRLYFLLEEVSE